MAVRKRWQVYAFLDCADYEGCNEPVFFRGPADLDIDELRAEFNVQYQYPVDKYTWETKACEKLLQESGLQSNDPNDVGYYHSDWFTIWLIKYKGFEPLKDGKIIIYERW